MRERYEKWWELGMCTLGVATLSLVFLAPVVFFWSEFSWTLLIPGVITGLALFFMVVGSIIERFGEE